ncbi:hypothetical protein Acr_26g0000290 [Actinidia rufa]|uniref:Uncharacterized protein n=1 Tax=Actinidia rufa TaxID=165716 RepID=A0A7J0H0Z3_9ERIC|nr:hypothetical protein Acr_26g0000290 [Actinidia rufa]
MTDKVNQLSSSPQEESSDHGESPNTDNQPPFEREVNIMTQGNLDLLRESCSVPFGIQAKLPKDDETIVSICPGEVTFYKAASHVGLCLPIHPLLGEHFISTTFAPPSLSPMHDEVSFALCQTQGGFTLRQGGIRPCSGGTLVTSKGERGSSSSSREMTRNSPWGYLRRQEFRKRCNKLPILTNLEEQRFNKVLKKIGSRGFFPIMVVLGSKAFCKCFAFGRKKMVSSGGDNAEDKLTKGATQVASDEEAKKKKARKGATPVVAPRKGTSANPGDVLGLNASMLENSAVAEKLLESVIPLFDWEDFEKMDIDQVVVLTSSLTECGRSYRMGLKKEIAELKAREVLAKKSVIEEYKTSDDFQEVVEQAASRYYGEGFNLFKK